MSVFLAPRRSPSRRSRGVELVRATAALIALATAAGLLAVGEFGRGIHRGAQAGPSRAAFALEPAPLAQKGSGGFPLRTAEARARPDVRYRSVLRTLATRMECFGSACGFARQRSVFDERGAAWTPAVAALVDSETASWAREVRAPAPRPRLPAWAPPFDCGRSCPFGLGLDAGSALRF